MLVARRYLRFELTRTGVLGGGFGAAAVAFAVLSINASAPIVGIHGHLPDVR
jgi:hypothetical protein